MPTLIDSNGNYAPPIPLPNPNAIDFGSGGGGGGGGGGSSTNDVIYEVTDPNTEGLTPSDPTKPSQAYKRDGTGETWGWDTNARIWT